MNSPGAIRTLRRLIPARRRMRPLAPLLMLMIALALVPLVTIALFQLAPDAPSPATGHAQVVAHGVSALPAASLAWRVVVDTAEPIEQAVAEERALGFALADQEAMLNTDQASGRRERLAAGESSFVPAGSLQLRSSLTGQPAPYYRLALVPAAQATDAGGDRLVFAGDAWDAPAGDQFDFDLIRDVIEPNEAAMIPATNGPAVVLATSGMIDVEANGAAPVRLGPGEAANFSGELAIFGVGLEPATFVAATLGPEVPPPPAPPTGSITINVVACPPGLTAAEAVAAGFSADAIGACQPAALPVNPVLILAGNQPLEPDQPNPEQGIYRWNFLLYSPFPVGELELPDGYGSYLLVNTSGIVGASESSGVSPTVADPNVLFVGADVPDAQAALFLFADEPTGGSLSLAPFACPEGTTANTIETAACAPATGSFDLTITSTSTAESQALADATQAPGSPFYTWSSLPLGDYALAVPSMPPGYTTFTIPGLPIDAATNTYIARLTDSTPDAQYNIYFLPDDDAGGGSITVAVFDCPPGVSRDSLVPAACRPSTGFELNLYPPTGGALGLGDAAVDGHVVTWSDLPFAEYAIEEVVLPPGYTEVFAELPTSRLSDRVYVATISESAPQAEIALYNLQVPAGAPAPTPVGSG